MPVLLAGRAAWPGLLFVECVSPYEQVVGGLAGGRHVLLHGERGVVAAGAAIPGNLARGLLGGVVAAMAVNAAQDVVLVVLGLHEVLVLLVMLGRIVGPHLLGFFVLDEQPFQVANVVGIDLVLWLDSRHDCMLWIPLGPVVARLVRIADLWRRKIFTRVALSGHELLVLDPVVAVAADL